MFLPRRNTTGFTLVELLISIAIIGIVTAVVFVALNPLALFAQSRNAQRWISVSELLDAVHLYVVQNDGRLPNESEWEEETAYMLGTDTIGCSSSCSVTTTASTCLHLSDLVADKRIADLPLDPREGTTGQSGLYARRESGSIVTIGICEEELGETIALTR